MKVISLLRAVNTPGQVVFRYLRKEWRFCVRIALLLLACAGAVLPSIHTLTHPWSTRQILRSEKANAAGSLWAPAAVIDDDNDDDQQSATNQERFVAPRRAITAVFSLVRQQVQAGVRASRTPTPRKIFFPLKLAPRSPASDPFLA